MQILTVSANFAEPFPYVVRANADDGGSWLQTNRVTGWTNESIQVSVQPVGLGRGVHRGTVAIFISVPAGGTAIELDVPVVVTLP